MADTTCWICSIDMKATTERTQICRDCRKFGILWGNDSGMTVREHRSGFEIVHDGRVTGQRLAVIGRSLGLDFAIGRAEKLALERV